MISRSGNRNFLSAHYDWLVLAVGLAALIGGALVYVQSLGEDAEVAANAEVRRVEGLKPAATGVKGVDMTAMKSAFRLAKDSVQVPEVSEKDKSFLASERRVMCSKCHKAISGDVKLCPECPYCGEKQLVEKKVVLDSDNDGLPDEWEKKFGLNPGLAADADADADGDGFTNREECAAKTDPKNPKDHPDYLDSLSVRLPLKKTYMPFVFTEAVKIPTGWRCSFFDPKQRDNYNRQGLTLKALIGEEIGKSGFVLKSCEKKEVMVSIRGGKNMTKAKDVTEVKVERKSDGKGLTLVISEKNSKPVPVDVQATLVYERQGEKTFDVVVGNEIGLNGSKYKIVEINPTEKGAKVTVQDVHSGKKRTLEALEQ